MGQPITVTQIINNPTLIPNDGRGGASAFFQDKGAVTGVFVVVGIAATAILVSVFYYFHRKRKKRKLEYDTAVAATLEEHGFGRQSLIGPDDVRPTSGPRSLTTPTGSGSSSDTRRTSSPSMSLAGINPGPVSAAGFGRQAYNPPYHADSFGQISYNPYADNQVPYRHTNPGPSDSSRMHNFTLPSVTGAGLPFFGHGPKYSMGSSEPLLGTFSDSEPEPPVPPVPPRNPQRPVGGATDPTRGDGGGRDNRGVLNEGSSVYTDDDVAYGGLRRGSLRVRNIPD